MIRDARIPIRFGALNSRLPEEAVLTDREEQAGPGVALFSTTPSGHLAGCRCCMPQTGASLALASLFRARATSRAAPFKRVLATVTPAGEAAIRSALQDDVMAAARYRLA